MKFLQYITSEETLQNLRDNFEKETNKLPKEEYFQKSEYFDRVLEALSDRIDEISDNVPYGTHSGEQQ